MRKVFLTLLLAFLASASYSQSGVIRDLTGAVELKPVGSSAFIPARAGSEVTQDTIISTGFKSTAIVAVGSTVITVQPLTRLSLAEISKTQDTERLNVNLQAGRIRVDVKPVSGTKANTVVQSPSATASVRGTSFGMDIFDTDVEEGGVDVEGNDGFNTTLYKGDKGSVDKNGSMRDAVELASSELNPKRPEGSGNSGEKTKPHENFSFDGFAAFGFIW